jgi:hypothetical protein
VSLPRRPKSVEHVLELTRRLAEEVDTVPMPMVSASVRSAVSAVRLFGDDVVMSLGTVEQIAREDLLALRATAAEQAEVAAAG